MPKCDNFLIFEFSLIITFDFRTNIQLIFQFQICYEYYFLFKIIIVFIWFYLLFLC